MTDPERYSVDQELFELVRKAGCAGLAWKLLADRLVRHGLAVLGPWIRSGWIFVVAEQKRMPLRPTPQERLLVETRFAEDFVQETVTRALERFRRNIIDGVGWDPDQGSSLASYFIGACVLAFVEQFRRSRRTGDLYQFQVVSTVSIVSEDGPDLMAVLASTEDVAGSVVERLAFRSRLEGLSERDRGLVWGKAMGLRGSEIQHLFDFPSVKAVEQRWARLKRDHGWMSGLDGKEADR
ncbi:RNA polymerase sigma factor [Nocardia heshunensis]